MGLSQELGDQLFKTVEMRTGKSNSRNFLEKSESQVEIKKRTKTKGVSKGFSGHEEFN